MAENDRIDPANLSDRELLIRLDERSGVMNTLFKEHMEAVDKKFIGLYRTQNRLSIAIAVLKTKSGLYGALGGLIISIVVTIALTKYLGA